MSVVFLKLFNMSITAGWLILFILLFRVVLKKAPSWTKCLLWGFVGLRLVLPFSIESILSLVPSAETIPQSNMLSTVPPEIDSGFATINQAINPVITETYNEYGNQFPSLISVFSVIWIIGLAIMLIYGVISYSTLYVKVRVSIKYKENIYLCDNIDSPFIFGIVKPKIYIPSGYSDEQMEYIIAHEKSHLKRKDHWWKPIGFALLSVYWFNPLIWVAYVLLCRDIELACDEKVIKDMENADMKGYSETLLNCSSTHRRVLVCPLAFGEISVKGRVKAMLNYKKPAFWVVAVAVTSCVIVAICFLTNPQKSENTDFSNNPSGVVEDSTNKRTNSNIENNQDASSKTPTENDTTKENEKTESTTDKTEKNETTTVESTTEESTTEKSTTEETTTEKTYPVLAESKADMIRLINRLTASASQGNYTLTRNCYAEDEFCASDMEKLNEIVQNVNPNATFNSAFNKHVNAGTTKANIQNGKATTDIRKEYLLIAMSITEDDIRNWRQRDNKIMVNLIDSYNYFIFEHVTNDFITVNTINEFISKYTMGYQVKCAHTGYGPLSLEVTIDDGKLTNLKINHSVHIDVEFESSNRMDGDYTTEITYSDIVYK